MMKRVSFKSKAQGFTLIELSIVLLIIGLLLAAVVKGRDLIRSAQIKKFYNSFIKQWEIIYNNYYDRTGVVLGGPLKVVDTNSNNNTIDYVEYVGVAPGFYNSSDIDLISRSPKDFKMVYDHIDSSNGWIVNNLIAAGIELPKAIRQYVNIYDLSATKLGKTTVILLLGSDPVSKGESLTVCATNNGNFTGSCSGSNQIINFSSGKGNGRGNFIMLVNLPFDVAPQIDKIIDGEVDAQRGRFICAGAYSSPKPVKDDFIGSNEFYSNNFGKLIKLTDIASGINCGGPFGWGNDTDTKYVTAIYKLNL